MHNAYTVYCKITTDNREQLKTHNFSTASLKQSNCLLCKLKLPKFATLNIKNLQMIYSSSQCLIYIINFARCYYRAILNIILWDNQFLIMNFILKWGIAVYFICDFVESKKSYNQQAESVVNFGSSSPSLLMQKILNISTTVRLIILGLSCQFLKYCAQTFLFL